MKPAFSLFFIYICALALTGFGDPAYFANKRGNENYNEKKYEDALKQYLEAQNSEPDEKSIDYNLGGAYYKLGRYDEAARAYERAVSSKSENVKKYALFNLGAALYKAGDMAASSGETDGALKAYRESAKQYKSLLAEDSADNAARHNLELALLKIKEMEQNKKKEQQQQNNKRQQENNLEKKPKQPGKDKHERSGQDKSEKNETGRENKKEGKDAPQQSAENKDGHKDQNKQKPGGQPKARQITKEQAERIFDAIERDEIKLKENIRKGQLKNIPAPGKDW